MDWTFVLVCGTFNSFNFVADFIFLFTKQLWILCHKLLEIIGFVVEAYFTSFLLFMFFEKPIMNATSSLFSSIKKRGGVQPQQHQDLRRWIFPVCSDLWWMCIFVGLPVLDFDLTSCRRGGVSPRRPKGGTPFWPILWRLAVWPILLVFVGK